MAAADFDVEKSQVASEGIIIKDGQIVHSSFFKDGLLTIQDESAMLPVESMPINPDDMILDACSAPGGKTTQIASRLKSGKVFALDIHKNKLKTVLKNATRMGVDKNIETFELDARKVDQKFDDELFDQILVDAPCSGLGLLRRKPEIRYDKTPEDIKRLSEIQLQILNAVAPKVKTGGMITYSTCTIVNQENQDVIDKFIKTHSNFEVTAPRTALNLESENDQMLKIYPDDYGSDGFFVSSLVRKS